MKYLRFIILPYVICFLLNCSEDQNDAQGDTGWKGSTNEFNEKFQKKYLKAYWKLIIQA